MSPSLPRSSLVVVLEALERYLLYFFVKPFDWLQNDIPAPVGKYVYDSTIRYILYLCVGLPFIYGMLFVSALVVRGPSVETATSLLLAHEAVLLKQLVSLGDFVQQSWVLIAVVIIGYYTVAGLMRYSPLDITRYRTVNQPEPEYNWERIVRKSIEAIPAWGLALTLLTLPSLTAAIPGGAVTLAVVFISASVLLLTLYFSHYASKHSDVPDHQEFARKAHASQVVDIEEKLTHLTFGTIITVYVGLVFVIAAVGGIPLGEAFLGLAVFRSLVAVRVLRLTLYEDKDGWFLLNPNVVFWNSLARVPVAFGLASLVVLGLSDLFSSGYWVLFVVPFAVSGVYVALRYWKLGELSYFCLPQSLYDPDEIDMRDHPIFQAVISQYSPESQKLLRSPSFKRSIDFKSLGHELYHLNQKLVAYEIALIGGRGILSLEGYRGQDSYDIRKIRLDWAERELTRVRKTIEADGDISMDGPLVEKLESAEAALKKAEECNERYGREFGDAFQNLLHKKSIAHMYSQKTDFYGNFFEDE